jgi:Holliday junction resolvase RusA-like endonuclease
MYGKRRVYKNPLANVYHMQCSAIFKKNYLPIIKMGDVRLDVTWCRKHNKGDIDGILKCMLDALQGLAYTKDSQIKQLSVNIIQNKTITLDEVLVEYVCIDKKGGSGGECEKS